MKLAIVGLGALLVLLMCSTLVQGQEFTMDTFSGYDSIGCEANPTGNPIGGGDGYDDIYETGDFIATSLEELSVALNEAQAGQVVFIPDAVEIDHTGVRLIVPPGVTLAGTRGLNGSLGARIFTTAEGRSSLARVGDGSRITGLRFEGPHGGTERTTIHAHFLGTGSWNVRVDNCEIYNFNYTVISVGKKAWRVYIHHNYIHHNQKGGWGYGVAVNGGSDVYVIANRFNYNRHHIASGGTPGCGYEAAWNWIGPNATSSHFDMHGGSDSGAGHDIAGDWMHIHHNTFLSLSYGTHVGIRGTPSYGADIHNNWFARPLEEAVGVGSTGNTRVFNNAYGPDKTVQEHAICFVDRGKWVECTVEKCVFCR
jgi:hypothetical protein